MYVGTMDIIICLIEYAPNIVKYSIYLYHILLFLLTF